MFSFILRSRPETEKPLPLKTRRSNAARFFLVSCFFLCASIILFQSAEYLLSLRKSAVPLAVRSAPVLRSLPDALSADGKSDINLASAADLTRVPGIGPSLAESILSYRDAVGGFRFIEEILDVSGIGPKRLEALRESFYCPLP